jgi:hypothetical protein
MIGINQNAFERKKGKRPMQQNDSDSEKAVCPFDDSASDDAGRELTPPSKPSHIRVSHIEGLRDNEPFASTIAR